MLSSFLETTMPMVTLLNMTKPNQAKPYLTLPNLNLFA